jgi:hypothetical protein
MKGETQHMMQTKDIKIIKPLLIDIHTYEQHVYIYIYIKVQGTMRKYNKVRDVNKTVYACVCLFVCLFPSGLTSWYCLCPPD